MALGLTHGIGASFVIFSMYIWRLTKGGIQNIIKPNEYRDFYVFLRDEIFWLLIFALIAKRGSATRSLD
jgi:hypothetical protein